MQNFSYGCAILAPFYYGTFIVLKLHGHDLKVCGVMIFEKVYRHDVRYMYESIGDWTSYPRLVDVVKRVYGSLVRA